MLLKQNKKKKEIFIINTSTALIRDYKIIYIWIGISVEDQSVVSVHSV